MKDNYQCIVVGAGPAGSTTAALLAQAGHATLLVEREKMPRYHVGESLMPETHGTLERLGVLERMKSGRFTQKVSVQFLSHDGFDSQSFEFQEHTPTACSATWQVERADFDQMLFENAAEKGAECYDQTCVTDVLMEGDQVLGVTLQTADGRMRTVACRVLVDATGQQALLANRLGLLTADLDLRKAAIWGYYRGARRDPGARGGATLILHTADKKSWFWYIPLANGVTSIGVVGDCHYLLKGRGAPAEVFEDELVKCPALIERLMDAAMVGNLHVAKEFSYTTRRRAGEGWVLVGDAYGSIDPIHSSGVLFAMKSGEWAADAIIEGFARGDLSAKQLGCWTAKFDRGVQWVRKLVHAFYTHDFSLGEFLKTHPEHTGNLTDLLCGRVFHDGAGRIFDDMDPWLAAARNGQRQLPPFAAVHELIRSETLRATK